MRARRTERTDKVLRLPGGTEDNDLWFYIETFDDEVLGVVPAICSVWVPSDEERKAIAEGQNIRLIVFADHFNPTTIDITDERIGGSASTGGEQES